jgi:hypothetical protein
MTKSSSFDPPMESNGDPMVSDGAYHLPESPAYSRVRRWNWPDAKLKVK